MSDEAELLAFIVTIYEQIGTDSLWPSVLNKFCEITRSGYGCLAIVEMQQSEGNNTLVPTGMSLAMGMDVADQRLYMEHYSKRDPWFAAGRHQRLHSGEFVLGHVACPDEVLVRTDTYQEFLGPRKLHYGACAALHCQGNRAATICTVRPRAAGPYECEAIAVDRLMPHLQRAVRLHFELESARCGATTILASLEHFPSAVFVVDHSSRILALNRKAEQMIATRDGLAVERSALTASLTSETGMLRRQISLAARDPIHDPDENGCFLISRQSLAEPYRVFVCPFPQTGVFPFSQRAALVFCVDPSAQPVSELKALKKAFGLTNAELLLVRHLAEGMNLEEASGRLGITRNTAKTQLQSVYSKTGARRQAELIKMLYTMPCQRL